MGNRAHHSNREWVEYEAFNRMHPPLQRKEKVPRTPFQKAGIAVGWLLGLGAVATAIFSIVAGCSNYQKGIYAGMHYNDAQEAVVKALVVTYGKEQAGGLRYAKPPVVNTHLDNLLIGTGQVRIFHLLGPEDVRYCVTVWGPEPNWTRGVIHSDNGDGRGINIGAHYLVQRGRGCHFGTANH